MGSWFRLLACLLLGSGCGEGTSLESLPLATSVAQSFGIVRGEAAGPTDYPAAGAILYSTERDGHAHHAFLCSGVLIAPDVVLAAGHCSAQLLGTAAYPVHLFFSLASDLSNIAESRPAWPASAIPVWRVVPHPDYTVHKLGRGLRDGKDLALFFLGQAIRDVPPASLITREEASLVFAGLPVVIVGYGLRSLPQGPHAAPSEAVGVRAFGNSSLGEVGPYEMQVGQAAREARKCYGDSGGPTFLAVSRGGPPEYILIGITSRTFDDLDCGLGGVDTRVDAHLAWITDAMEEGCRLGIRPTCDGST